MEERERKYSVSVPALYWNRNEAYYRSLYKFVEEWDPGDQLLSPQYCNSTEQDKDDDDAMELPLRKK